MAWWLAYVVDDRTCGVRWVFARVAAMDGVTVLRHAVNLGKVRR